MRKSSFLPVLLKSLAQLVLLTAVFLGIDMISKYLVYTNLEPWTSIQVIGDFFRISHVQNRLVAFGFLSSSQWHNLPLAILVIGTIVILVIVFQDVLLDKIPPLKRLADYLTSEIGSLDNSAESEETEAQQKPITIHKIMFPLFIAALAGNVIDRFLYGYVVDFFDFGLFGFRWPSFNFADFYLVTLLILFVFGGVSQVIVTSENESGEEKSRMANFLSLEGLLIVLCLGMAGLGFVFGRYETFVKDNIAQIQAVMVSLAIIAIFYYYIVLEKHNYDLETFPET
ncbi:MAG: signal peptidase II [Candidatus Promineifilaceae bacterium]|jgi:signal peptidase II